MIHFTFKEITHFFTCFNYKTSVHNTTLKIKDLKTGEVFYFPKRKFYTPSYFYLLLFAYKENLRQDFRLIFEQIRHFTQLNRIIKEIEINNSKTK